MKRCFLVAALLAMTCALYAQEFRATISGAVTDASGATIAGAKVTINEINTGVKVEITSDASGHYTAPALLPGDYDITVKVQGFKENVRKAIHVGAGEHPVLDVRLEVGDTSVTVEVTAEAPIVNSENASVGQAITTKELEDLPSNGGSPMVAAQFTMGVLATAQPATVQPFASGGSASWSIAGSPNQTSELLVDGSPNATWDGRLAYSPPMDVVQEVRVKAFDSDASYGHTGAGTANVILKSGTNAFHGSLYEKNQPTNMVANNFFNNASGLPVAVTHYNQYGATAGGPIFIPKVVDGRNRVFWFFGFEGVRDSTPSTGFTTVPTDAERTGDFSKLLTLATPTVLYNPYSAVLTGTTITRTAYPGNKIPASQLSPIAQKMLQFYPEPILTTFTRSDDFQNYAANTTSRDGYTNEFGRADINFTQNQRTYFNIRHTDYFQSKNDFFNNIATGSYLSRSNWGGSIDHVYTVNASNIINVRANFTRMFEDHANPSAGFDPATLGFPALLAGNSQYLQLPFISFATNSGYQALSSNGANVLPSQSTQLFGNWLAIRGKHQLKIGGDARLYKLNYKSYGSSTGNFAFTNNNWVRASSSASSTVAKGQDFAEFLLGLPTGGQYDQNASAMFYSYYAAGFIQDDWRVKNNLTLNIGVRFDHDFPYHEKWGRTVNGFATTTPSPIEAAAVANYNASPIAQIPAGSFKVPGGLTFASPDNSSIYRNTSHLISPRFGFAWTPNAMHGKTSIRGGIALFVSPLTISTLQISGAYSTNPILTQEGFSQSTTLTSTTDNSLTPAATLANPFPAGIQQPSGSAAGLLTFLGQAVNFQAPDMKNPYSVRWNFGVQHAIRPNLVLEVVYVGNHGVHLPVTYTQLNGLPRKYLSTLPVRDQATITALTATVPNPLRGLVTSGTPAGATTNVAQLLARFPQFPLGYTSGIFSGSGGVSMQDADIGASFFENLNVGITKRMSHGLQVRFNYMLSKTIDQRTWLNDTDPNPERRISPFDHPHRFSTAVVYEFPIGKGKAINLQNRFANAAIGGWSLSSTYTYQIGAPLTWVNGSTSNAGDYVYFGAPLDVQTRNTNGNAFNVNAFDRNTANAFQYHIRTFSTTFPNVRQDGINDWNTSIGKRFAIREKMSLQVRCDAFNVINHPMFAAPNTTVSNSSFGQITAQSNRSRMLQLWARLSF